MDGSTRKVDAEDARVAIGALWTPGSSAVDTAQGLRPGPGDPGKVAATGTPGINVTVNSFQGLVTATRGAGGYIVTEPAQLTVPILDVPADPSNDRWDLIIYRQADTYYGDGATLSGVIRVQGSPSGTPADPSLAAYPDYLPLARIRVTAGTPTITNAMIDDLRPGWTVALGGVKPVLTLTERATLSHWAGRTIYRIDKGWEEVSDGTAWRIRGFVTAAALADVTDPYTGQLVLLSTDSMIYRWTGAAWLGVKHTAAGGGQARYQATVAQTIPNTTDTKITFATVTYSHTDFTMSGNNTLTANRAGLVTAHSSLRMSTASGGSGEVFMFLGSGSNSAVRYAIDSKFTTAPVSMSLADEFRVAVNDTISLYVWQSGGGARDTDVADAGGSNHLALSWRAA
jgi:hypothetical protein